MYMYNIYIYYISTQVVLKYDIMFVQYAFDCMFVRLFNKLQLYF